MATEITVTPPTGSHWELEEVKTKRGTESLGEHPILVWDDFDAAVSFYSAQGVLDMLDGTSLRVSQQGIIRRLAAAGKDDNAIAEALVAFRPGKRAGGASTPNSRAVRAAKTAAEKVDGDQLARLLEKVASGEISLDNLVGAEV